MTEHPGRGVQGLADKLNRSITEVGTTSGVEMTDQRDHRLDDLDADRSAILLGGRSVEQVEAMAPKADRPYVRAALEDYGAMDRALKIRSYDRGTGLPSSVTFEQRAGVIVERAAMIRQAHEYGERHAAERARALTCQVTGRVDETTTYRRLPWGNTDTLRISLAGHRAVLAAYIAAADPADLEAATRWLADRGDIDPQPKGKKH